MPIRPLLLGHRGRRGEKSVPENTPAAFDCAVGSGCDGFEFDVRHSADGEAVVCHDDATSGKAIARTLAGELGLPLLRDVLKRYQTSAFLDIELKVPGLEKITLDLIQACQPTHGYVVSSFLPEVLRATRALDASAPLGLICETEAQFGLWSELPVQYVITHYRLVRRRIVTEIQKRDCKVLVWTVNLAADIKRFTAWGVDGIISDNPENLVRVLGREISSRE